MNYELRTNLSKGVETVVKLFAVVIVLGSFYVCNKAYAGLAEKLKMNAEAEYRFSDFAHNPEPSSAYTGNKFSQDYRLHMRSGMFKHGVLDTLFGVSFADKYRGESLDLEDKIRFDYGKWLRVETITKHETDDNMFFSGTVEPQSPIYTVTRGYNSRLALSRTSFMKYDFESRERKDLLLGTVTNEKTSSQRLRFTADTGSLDFNGEYRLTNFEDNLGTRSNVDSTDLSLEATYRPKDYFRVSASFEDNLDEDVDNNTELHSTDYHFEFILKPVKGFKVRDKIGIRDDEDTRTNEDISNMSNEFLVNFDPWKQVSLEFAYKTEEEDKERVSTSINSNVVEQRYKVRFIPLPQINLQSGYEVSGKTSSSSTENIENTKLYYDVTLEPVKSLRIGGNISRWEQTNTFTSEVESDTKSMSATLQYKPKRIISLFLRLDTTRTDNPITDAFTKTNTMSSNLDFDLLSFLNVSLRTSGQETTGSADSSYSERLLNSVEFNIDLFDNLRLSTEYEIITSNGISSSDESLYDIAAFYNAGKMDISFRFQERTVEGDNPTDKKTMLSSFKYKFTKNAVFSIDFSFVDYLDKTTSVNSYDSTLIEGSLFLRF